MTWFRRVLQAIRELTAPITRWLSVTRWATWLDRILQMTWGAVFVPLALTAVLLGVLLAVCRCEGVL